MENKKTRILAIDDNHDNLIILKALIHEAFPESAVFIALTGRQGLTIAFAEDPDVILLDVIMPGMDGFDVCRELKSSKSLKDIPIIFLTATNGNRENRIQALECGAEAFLSKPIDESELTAQIRAMLKIRAANILKRDESSRLSGMVDEKTRELNLAHAKTTELFESLKIENESRKASEAALWNQEKYLRAILETAQDGFWVINNKSEIIDVNESFCHLTGYSRDELLSMKVQDLNEEDSPQEIDQCMKYIMETGSALFVKCYRRKDGSFFDFEIAVMYLVIEAMAIFVSFGNDITDRKRTEDHLLYQSTHDHLTGLYNRSYFENALENIDTAVNLPISIIIGDINGLKLVNDSFGHAMGDELLIIAANTIRQECRPQDIIARLGGDEFVIVLPKTNLIDANKIADRINERVIIEKTGAINVSISFGYDSKSKEDESIQQILISAENHMYRHKLNNVSSMRSKTVDLIMKALFEKSNREMLHSKRVSEICEAIAFRMGFNSESVKQVRTAGLMHDIGKIGIPESILNKNVTLNETERVEIRKHPEIGWRILCAANEFSELADSILEHHERLDGSGYPKGLKGDEISMVARIISLADAYDAMTSERSYRKALSQEEAIKEIIRCTGTQFDPVIVDVFLHQLLPDSY